MSQKAVQISNDAMNRIHSDKLSPIPEVYELWYVYYCDINPELKHAMDMMIDDGEAFTDDNCLKLYQKYLNDSVQEKQVRQAGEKIQKTIRNVSQVVGDVKTATQDFNDNLKAQTENLKEGMSVEDVKSVVGSVLNNTSEMLEQNQKLENELSQSADVIADMQRSLEAARHEARTDSLTGVSNRKAFEDEIARVVKEAKENETKFSLLMMDIDHFKSFNDNYGHQVGDQVLKLVARTLVDGVKGRDIVCRYGGEEFAVILPETELQGSIRVGDSLRNAVANKELINRSNGENLGRITLSGGVAESVEGETVEEIVGRADSALYTAKHNGRNQVAAAAKPSK